RGNFSEKKNFLKKIGSNPLLRERLVFVEYKNPWKLLENSFAEARGEAPSEAGNQNFTNWLPFREMKLNVKVNELSKDCRELPFFIEHRKLYHIDPSFGYRLTIDGKSIAYCADTGVCRNSVYLARGADVLIHECAAVPKFISGKWGHTNPEEAAGVAKKAHCKKLILTHFSANRYVMLKNRYQAQEVARKIFKNTIAAHDDMIVNV
ncbi:MAG: hypothetical protein COW51_00365, partial [Candidatus Moranbacteria bacterium CG17_big_fil_post_rev_8_21_14_2_50_44_12]